ncbi:MAG: response regulator, partial [Cyanobacteria bacterium P01_F01_bin.13]
MAIVSSDLTPVKSSLRIGLGRVLIVEDEELIRETVALALAEEGFEIVVAADGPNALEKLLGSADGSKDPIPDISLVILDLMLPGMNGLDLCRLVRHRGLNVPILILSAKGTEMDRVVGLEVGADDYLSKPFGMRELIA